MLEKGSGERKAAIAELKANYLPDWVLAAMSTTAGDPVASLALIKKRATEMPKIVMEYKVRNTRDHFHCVYRSIQLEIATCDERRRRLRLAYEYSKMNPMQGRHRRNAGRAARVTEINGRRPETGTQAIRKDACHGNPSGKGNGLCNLG